MSIRSKGFKQKYTTQHMIYQLDIITHFHICKNKFRILPAFSWKNRMVGPASGKHYETNNNVDIK
jgi:hypothetical protein